MVLLVEETPIRLRLPEPRTFAGLMEIYESNYMRMRKLCADVRHMQNGAVSRATGAMDLHLFVLEHTKYTTTILLTYYFKDCPEGPQPLPNLRVRVYHDARQAEVISYSSRRNGQSNADDLPPNTELGCKWQLNCLLYKWLDYCLNEGHVFGYG